MRSGRFDLPHIAIVGRPNVGKSSLTNALLGEDRNIVTPVAGTTRDAISTYYNKFGHEFMLVDTAGIRKKNKVHEDLEFYSVLRSIRAIEHSDICILMIDATLGMEAQDMSIFNVIQKNRKGCVLVVNKWDLFEKESNTMREYTASLKARIAPFDDVPVIFTSVTGKQRILQVLDAAARVAENMVRRIPTSELNDVMLPEIENYPPPAWKGKYVKIKYVTQLPTRTPQFPFLALWQVNESANRGSGSDATPSTSRLDADELATLPADAFKRTAYLCDSGKKVAYELSFSGLTPGADYLLEFYLNEPWQLNTRAQKVQINGETVKDANGDDLVVDPGVIGGNAIKTIGKIAFTNVTAQANGTISFSFPLAKDQPVLNVATLSGTNLPTAAALELKMSGEGAGTLSWGAARDTLAYYVESRTGDGAWTPLATLDSSVRSLAVSPAANARTEYRVVSSNGLGTVTSAVRTYLKDAPRVRYALNIGETSAACGWFVPANAALVSPYRSMTISSGQSVNGLDGPYLDLEALYRTYGYQIGYAGKNQIALAFSNLTANAEYEICLHSIEPWSLATNERTARQVNILTNGVQAGAWPITKAGGYVPFTAVYTNLTAYADGDGRLEIALGKDAQDAVLCGVEVLARADEPMSGDVPETRLVEFADGIHVVPETRHAQFAYEIQCKDSEDGAVTTLATAASAFGMLDRTVPAGATRNGAGRKGSRAY